MFIKFAYFHIKGILTDFLFNFCNTIRYLNKCVYKKVVPLAFLASLKSLFFYQILRSDRVIRP